MGCSTDTKNTLFQPAQIIVIIKLKSIFPYKSKSYLHQRYVEEGMSCQSIADEVGCSRSTILKYLRIHGIESIAPGQNRKRKRGLAYGMKSEVVHKRELLNIQKMKDFRVKGYSYEKIANIFNTMKIPTKTRRGKWHRKTICSILNNNC